MKVILLTLLFVTNVEADGFDELYLWLPGKWVESNADCPTVLEFNKYNNIKITSINTKATGSYKITGKAVVIPKDSSCWKYTCYEMEYNIIESGFSDGCGVKMERGKYEFNNFRKINVNSLELNGFIFKRES